MVQLRQVYGFRVVLLMASLIVGGLVRPPASAAAVGFVQVNAATPNSTQSTVAVAYASAQSAGDLNVVAIGWGDSTHTVLSVTDSMGNAYAPALGTTVDSSFGLGQTIYYARNIKAAPAGGNTVTVNFNAATPYPDVRILEYSGADGTIDVTATGTGSGTTSSTVAVTTTNANDLLFAANVVATANTAAGTGFTSRIISGDGNIAEDRTVTAVGSYSATATLTSGQWVAQMVAFRAGAADTTPPSAPSNLAAAAASVSQISLSWTASTDNVGVTGYMVERCQGTGCSNFAQIAAPAGTAYNDTGLTPATSYSYRVRATDAAGNLSAYSNTASTSTPADTTPPSAPTNLTSTPISSSQINLAWTASTDNVGVTGYMVERCQGTGCSNFAQIATPAGTTYNDTGLTVSVSYSYRVRATDAAGNLSGYSNTTTATTAADTTPPSAPSNLTATPASTSQINLAWTASTDNVGVTGYMVERCQGAGCSSFAQIAAPTTSTYNDTGLAATTSYSYRVRATDAAGNLSAYSNTASATTLGASGTITFVQTNSGTPNSTQSTVAVTYSSAQTAGDLNAVVIGWGDSTHTVLSVTDSMTNAYAPALGTTVNSAFGLSQTIYYAKNIKAAPAGGNTVTVTFSGATPYPDIRVLEYKGADLNVPVDVTATGTGSGTTSSTAAVTTTNAADLLLAANVVATSNTAAGTGFTSRGISSDGNIVEDRTVTVVGSYSATASLSSGQWVAQMVAFRAASSVVDTTPPSAPSNLTATPSGASQINLSWTASTDNVGVTGYMVERCQGAGCSNFAQIAAPGGTAYNDTGLAPSISYSYRVRATDAAGNLSSYSSTASASTPADTTPPSAPTNLTATPVSPTQINLSWTASTDNVGVTGYMVERCQGTGCSSFVQIASPRATSYNDTGLSVSPSYSYRVRATDGSGNLSTYSNTAIAATSATNPVIVENQQPGSGNWQIGDIYGRPVATDTAGQIKGYASATSVNKGQTIDFHVSVKPAQTYTIDVYRIGWYGGLGGRLMQHIGPLNGATQPTCPTNATTGTIECNWTVGYTLDTQTSWTSGIYLAVLANAQGFYNYMIFAVRDDTRVAALLYQQPVMTAQAYNNWPDDGATGKSLYDFNSAGANTIAGSPRAVKVSFDRPYDDDGSGNFIWQSAINTLFWLEKSGYDVTYSTNMDTHLNGAGLLNYRGFLSVPHDEYWSKPMYDAVISARDAGVNLAFFGSNSIFWQVRIESSSTGVANRVVVCYKDATIDPTTDPSLTTINWRSPPVNRSEQGLMGIEFNDGPNNGTADYVVINSGNWMYAGTGFTDGTHVPRVVWYETDQQTAGDPLPVAVSGTYTLLSHSPYTGSHGATYANSSIYQALSGAWVFASGTHGWGWGLDDFYPQGGQGVTHDVRIQQATANLLNRFLGQ